MSGILVKFCDTRCALVWEIMAEVNHWQRPDVSWSVQWLLLRLLHGLPRHTWRECAPALVQSALRCSFLRPGRILRSLRLLHSRGERFHTSHSVSIVVVQGSTDRSLQTTGGTALATRAIRPEAFGRIRTTSAPCRESLLVRT